jgi:hypothetical protein
MLRQDDCAATGVGTRVEATSRAESPAGRNEVFDTIIPPIHQSNYQEISLHHATAHTVT